MAIKRVLGQKGITIPTIPTPVAAYAPGVITGNLVFVSGQTPTVDGVPRYSGKLGHELDVAKGREAARLAALNCLAELELVLGDLDRVTRIVKVTGYVASAEGFTEQPQVVNGASELFLEIWQEKGQHARAAVGVAELPGGAPVEIELIAEIS